MRVDVDLNRAIPCIGSYLVNTSFGFLLVKLTLLVGLIRSIFGGRGTRFGLGGLIGLIVGFRWLIIF